METPAQQCVRLLAAVEELVLQESWLIGAEEYEEVIRIQIRTAPLVERLATLAPFADMSSRRRAAAVIHMREDNGTRIAQQIKRVEDDLHSTDLAHGRVVQIGPAYGTNPAMSLPHRLAAHG